MQKKRNLRGHKSFFRSLGLPKRKKKFYLFWISSCQLPAAIQGNTLREAFWRNQKQLVLPDKHQGSCTFLGRKNYIHRHLSLFSATFFQMALALNIRFNKFGCWLLQLLLLKRTKSQEMNIKPALVR